MADVKHKSSKDEEDLKRSYREKQLDNNEKSRSWEREKRSNSDDSYRLEKKDKCRKRNRDRKVDEEEKYGEGSSRWSTNNYELNKCKRDRDRMDGEDYWIPGERGGDNYELGKKYKRSRARNVERPSRRYIEHKCEDRDQVRRAREEEEVLKSKKVDLEWEKKKKKEWARQKEEWAKQKEEWEREKKEWEKEKLEWEEEWEREKEWEKEKLERKKEWEREREKEEWEWRREIQRDKEERVVSIVAAQLRSWRSNSTNVLSDWLAVPILEPVTDFNADEDFCPYRYLEETTG